MVKGAVTMVFRDDPQLGVLAVLVAVGVAVYAGVHAGQVQPGAHAGRALVSSPVLLVWTALLGTVWLGFSSTGVLTFTALAGLGAVVWLRRRGPVEVPGCGPDCDCHANGAGGSWELAPEATDRTTPDAETAGWVHAVVQLDADVDTDWSQITRRCLEQVLAELAQCSARLLHAKLLLTTGTGSLTLTQAGKAEKLSIEGDASGASLSASLIMNVRAEVAPDELKTIIEKAITAAASGPCRAQILQTQALRPSGPKPPAGRDSVVAQQAAGTPSKEDG
jgi:hypothetical protein